MGVVVHIVSRERLVSLPIEIIIIWRGLILSLLPPICCILHIILEDLVDLLVIVDLVLRIDSDGVSVLLPDSISSFLSERAVVSSVVLSHAPRRRKLVFHWVLHRWFLVHAGEGLAQLGLFLRGVDFILVIVLLHEASHCVTALVLEVVGSYLDILIT